MILILFVYRDHFQRVLWPVDQKLQREAPSAIKRPNKLGVEFWAQHPLQIDPIHIQITIEMTCGKRENFGHPQLSMTQRSKHRDV